MKKDQLFEARSIAHQLISQAASSNDKMIWHLPLYDSMGNLLRKNDYSLASGTCGIIYFLTELYSIEKSASIKSAIEKSINGLRSILNSEPSSNYGLYTGMAGVAYLYLKLYKVTNDSSYLDEAIKIGQRCDNFLRDDFTNNSLFEGRAGVILILTFLNSLSQNNTLEQNLKLGISSLLWETKFSKNGASWHYSQTQTGDVLSWGYGNAGIAFVLKTTADMLGVEYLNSISERSQLKINRAWDSRMKNWPNHNFKVETPQQDRKILKQFRNNKSKATTLRGMDSFDFANGSIGIIYSFLNTGFGYMGNQIKIEKAILRLAKLSNLKLNTESRSVLITMMKSHNSLFRKFSSSNLANKIEGKYKKLNNWGLQDGLAGAGYHSLVMSGLVSDPYFSLKLKFLESNTTLYKSEEIKKLKLMPSWKAFPRTLHLLSNEFDLPKKLDDKLKKGEDVNYIVKALVADINDKSSPIHEAYRLEKAKNLFLENQKSLLYFVGRQRSFMINRALQTKSKEKLLKTRFYLNKQVKVIKSKINTSILNESPQKGFKIEQTFTIFVPIDEKESPYELQLSGFEELLLLFKNPITPRELLSRLADQLEIERQPTLESKLLDLILSKVQEGILEVD